MEPVYYNAAAKIEIGVLEDISKPLNQLLTPNTNTWSTLACKADYYNGAANGEIGVFKYIPEPLDQLLTPNRNTVLHIYLTNLRESESKDLNSKD
ncbi:hypothetical protein CFP56_016229 [Quercus suber]|uniref:Uncharacterized protein n=1 Tax=Quercus suber TaxID=58331 RepID=A0AAW0KN40_QUESU